MDNILKRWGWEIWPRLICITSTNTLTKNFWQRMWKIYTLFLTSTQTALKTLQLQWRNRLKERQIRSGLHSRKVELSRVKYFHTFVSCLNYVSPIGTNCDKRRWSYDERLDRELSTCLSTNYKKRNQVEINNNYSVFTSASVASSRYLQVNIHY